MQSKLQEQKAIGIQNIKDFYEVENRRLRKICDQKIKAIENDYFVEILLNKEKQRENILRVEKEFDLLLGIAKNNAPDNTLFKKYIFRVEGNCDVDFAKSLFYPELKEEGLFEKYIFRVEGKVNAEIAEMLFYPELKDKVDKNGRSLFEKYIFTIDNPVTEVAKMLFYPELKYKDDDDGRYSIFEKYITNNLGRCNPEIAEMLFYPELKDKDDAGYSIFEIYICKPKAMIEIAEMLFYPELKDKDDVFGNSIFENYVFNNRSVNHEIAELLFFPELKEKVCRNGKSIIDNYFDDEKNSEFDYVVSTIMQQ